MPLPATGGQYGKRYFFHTAGAVWIFLFPPQACNAKIFEEGGDTMEEKKTMFVEITDRELQVIELLREVEYGELRVSVKAGKPVRVEEIKKSIQID